MEKELKATVKKLSSSTNISSPFSIVQTTNLIAKPATERQ